MFPPSVSSPLFLPRVTSELQSSAAKPVRVFDPAFSCLLPSGTPTRPRGESVGAGGINLGQHRGEEEHRGGKRQWWSSLTPEQVLQLSERIFYGGRLLNMTPAERKNESV